MKNYKVLQIIIITLLLAIKNKLFKNHELLKKAPYILKNKISYLFLIFLEITITIKREEIVFHNSMQTAKIIILIIIITTITIKIPTIIKQTMFILIIILKK
jgi:hypothetical protein